MQTPPDIFPPKNSFGIFLKKYLPDREECAGVKIFLSVIHDYDHPGLNNNFHIKIQSYLATLYNDRAILENHHLAEIFDIVKDPTFDIFGDFSDEQRRDIRETMIEMVTGTDMGLHAKIFGAWKRRIKQDHSMGLLNRHLFSDDSFQTIMPYFGGQVCSWFCGISGPLMFKLALLNSGKLFGLWQRLPPPLPGGSAEIKFGQLSLGRAQRDQPARTACQRLFPNGVQNLAAEPKQAG